MSKQPSVLEKLDIDPGRILPNIDNFGNIKTLADEQGTDMFTALTTEEAPFLLVQLGLIQNRTLVISNSDQFQTLFDRLTAGAMVPVPPGLILTKVLPINQAEVARFKKLAAAKAKA